MVGRNHHHTAKGGRKEEGEERGGGKLPVFLLLFHLLLPPQKKSLLYLCVCPGRRKRPARRSREREREKYLLLERMSKLCGRVRLFEKTKYVKTNVFYFPDGCILLCLLAICVSPNRALCAPCLAFTAGRRGVQKGSRSHSPTSVCMHACILMSRRLLWEDACFAQVGVEGAGEAEEEMMP